MKPRPSRAEYQRAWRAAHPGAARQHQKRYKVAHRESILAAGRKYASEHREASRLATVRYRAAHPDSVRASYAKWLGANVEEERARSRAYHAADRPRARAASRAWLKANPEKRRAIKLLRRARKLAATVQPFSVAQWSAVVARYGGLCAYCRVRPWEHQEHVIPLARGGAHAITNVVPACADCNQRKGTKVWTPAKVEAIA